MAEANILKKIKNYYISAVVWHIGPAFGMMMHIGPENQTSSWKCYEVWKFTERNPVFTLRSV